MADVIKTKTFRNGGSLAVRIPAGWLSDGELSISRDTRTGRIVITQDADFNPNEFFNFVRKRGFVEDPALLELPQRADQNRANILDQRP